MRVTIIVRDNIVAIDGVARRVDLSDLDQTINAIQWDGAVGDVEFWAPTQRNLAIRDLGPYQVALDRWAAVKPPNPPPPPTKDDLIDFAFQNPAMRAVLLELANRLGVTTEAALRTAIKSRMP